MLVAVIAEPLVPVPAAPEGSPYRHLRVTPLTTACGARVEGVDLGADLDDVVIAEIRRAVLDHQVIFFQGQTLAYSTLSTGMRQLLCTLVGRHSAVNAYSPKMQPIHDSFTGMVVHTSDDANRVQRHPVVRRHPETGRPALFANAQYTVGLEGFSPHEAKPLLDFVFEHAVRPEFSCRWRWSIGDVAFWDNRALQHMAMADFIGHRRAMHRTTVAGDRPVGVA